MVITHINFFLLQFMNCWISLRTSLLGWSLEAEVAEKRDPGCPTWFLHVCNLAQLYPRELQTSIGSSNFLLFEYWQTHALLDVHLLNEVNALHLQHIKGFNFESTTLGTIIEVRFSFFCAICCGIERWRRGFWKMLICHRIGHKSNTQVQTMWYLHNCCQDTWLNWISKFSTQDLENWMQT
jgi:hypothetical protein